MKMASSSHIIALISSAFDILKLRQTSINADLKELVAVMLFQFGVLRTFLLCSEQIHSRTELTLANKLRTFVLCSTTLDNNHSAPNTSLGSLLVMVEDVVSRILDANHDLGNFYTEGIKNDRDILYVTSRRVFSESIADMISFEEDMDEWYANHLQNPGLRRQSSSQAANRVKDIADSVLANLDGFLNLPGSDYVGFLKDSVEALKESIAFWRQLIHYVTLLAWAKNQEILDLLALIEALIVSAAHLTLHPFSASHFHIVDVSISSISYKRMESMISALLLKMYPVHDLHLHETYARALASIEKSRKLHVPALNLKVFIAFLLSTLWEMLQFDSSPVVSSKDKLQVLYEGLRSLRTMLKKKANKFDERIMDITAATVHDAGITMFSLYQKDFAIDCRISDFVENIKVIRTVLLEEIVVNTSKNIFLNTTILCFLDSLLDYSTEIKSSHYRDLNCLPEIREYLVFLRSLMGKLVSMRNQHGDLHQALWNFAVEVASKIESLIDQLVLVNILDSFSLSLQSIREGMMIIRTDSIKIFDNKREKIKVQEAITWISTDHPTQSSMTAADDQVVGFEIERSLIIDRLIRGSKRLQVVSIVGMPGLGKTTLAKIVYNDPSASLHFHVRGWCSISQVFNRKRVLLELLNHIKEKPPSEYFTRNEDDLAEELWRSLKGRRYLIVMDDVWDIQAFDYLKGLLPDDSTESRILLTSRHCDTGRLDEEPHFLRQLTRDESLELLKGKFFPGKDWPPSLYDIGIEIAEYCKGLPLTIVIVAGLLRASTKEVWKEVLGSLRSGVISTTDQCMNTIELSYKHLPDHLKSCLLLFGAFPEDQVLSVKRLIWFWIAEGFVKKSESKSLEEVARDYLDNLIGRSLVMNAKERSRGGVKACRVHDLLYDFCLRKANEESFMHQFKVEREEAEEYLSSDELEFVISSSDKPEFLSFSEIGNLRRLCIYSEPKNFMKCKLFCPRLRSLLFFHPTKWPEEFDVSFIPRIFKLLRVLDIGHVHLAEFPNELGLLIRLRYLAIQVAGVVGPSIGNLSNLETLILFSTATVVTLPGTFWNLQKLRHLFSTHECRSVFITLPGNSLEKSLLELECLSSLSSYDWGMVDKQLRKFPNIRQINCKFYVSEDDLLNGSQAMDFSFLSKLESLSLSVIPDLDRSDFEFIFPENIKKLSLSECGLPWTRISRIAELPNLVVLKLLGKSFVGDAWHVEEGEFPKLKFLKLENLDIVEWTASDDQFPNLEKLILEECWKLEEIPECLESVATLKMIEVIRCTERIVSSVEKVEEYQKDMGNSVLQVHVRSIWDDASEDIAASLWKLD